jgi:hypothetical protein
LEFRVAKAIGVAGDAAFNTLKIEAGVEKR